MDRRSFLTLTALAPLAAARFSPAAQGNNVGLRLSVTWGMMGKLPVPEGLSMLEKFGYNGYEMFDWRNASLLEAFVAEREKHRIPCVCLIANKGVTAPGCGLVNPRERDGFMQELQLAIEAARRVDCKRLVVLTGNELGGLSRSEQMANAVTALKGAAPLLEKSGITAVVEVLNTYVNHAGYFLYYIRDGADLVDRVGSPNVKILFDLYHTQVMEGNLIENLRTYIAQTGHFHVADVPGRNQPGTGEINYRNVFKAIHDLGDGYQGFVSLEYRPTIPIEQDLPAVRKLASF